MAKITCESHHGATWPAEVMTGAAGDFARTYGAYLETPKAFLFMCYLGILGHIISDKVTLNSGIAPQPRLYITLLGESADTRKTTAINKTLDFFKDTAEREITVIQGVGSAEGLAKTLESRKKVLLIQDELQALVLKCQIDGSTLLTCVNTLFEKDFYQNETSRQSVKVDGGHLSLLAASTLDTYETMFHPRFLNIGFINRFFLVTGSGQRKFAIPKRVPEAERQPLVRQLNRVLAFVRDLANQHGGLYALPIDPEAEAIFEKWYLSSQGSEFSKRLETYGHRLMILLAVNALQDRVTSAVTTHVISLLRYQLAARQQADPIQADTQIAKLEEKIRRLVRNGPIAKRGLERNGHKQRAGNYAWKCALDNLEKAGEVRFDRKAKIYRPGPEL